MDLCRRRSVISSIALSVAVAITYPAPSAASGATVTIDRLEWTLRTNGKDIRWPDAIDYCADLELAGQADWRLPSMNELQSLHDPDASGGRGIRGPFVIDTCCLWSGESLERRAADDGSKPGGPPGRYHWGFMFDGGAEYYAVDIFDDGQALCVRDSG